ncbi:MAG: hypothetical protein WAK31_25940 [Chthoniobacterales bacterium]
MLEFREDADERRDGTADIRRPNSALTCHRSQAVSPIFASMMVNDRVSDHWAVEDGGGKNRAVRSEM